jgi:hydroxyquinol 1,2-dioxygenase
MVNIDERTITNAVLEVQARCADPRLQQIMSHLVRHLHDFAREVQLTQEEWFAGIRFLTDVGHITDDKRQEFILLSDTLGLSTLVTAQNNAKPAGCTEATVFGPFFVEGAPGYENGDDISNGASGEPCFVSGTVRGLGDTRIAGAKLAVWQSDDEGLYDVQRPGLEHHQARGNLRTNADGSFRFRSILPVSYPIPHDGPVGRMLEELGRHPWRPAHLHFMIEAPGYETLITHIFRRGGEYLESDAVFGVRSSLIADWVRHESGIAPDGARMERPYHTLHFDFVLSPAKGAK